MARNSATVNGLILHGVQPTTRVLGKGAYGEIIEVEFCGTLCAGKKIHSALIEDVSKNQFESVKSNFIEECIRHSTLRHPNIVQFIGIYYSSGDSSVTSQMPVMVMELMKYSLTTLVKDEENMPHFCKLSMLLDVTHGLRYLHGHHPPIVHRDLTPNNILINGHLVAKIGDLGVAAVIAPDSESCTRTQAPGTLPFMSPEALQDRPKRRYGPSLDVFSFSCVTLYLLVEEWPAPLNPVAYDDEMVAKRALSEVERRQKDIDQIPEHAANLKSMIIESLDDNPTKRPSITDVSAKIAQELHSCKLSTSVLDPIAALSNAVENSESHKNLQQQVSRWKAKAAELQAELDQFQHNPGQHEFDLFDGSVKIRWVKGKPAPGRRIAHTMVQHNGLIYIASGYEGEEDKDSNSFQIDVFDPVNCNWSASIKVPHKFFAVTVVENMLTIVGGLTQTKDATKKVMVWKHGFFKSCWVEYSEMQTARFNAAAASFASKLIVMGGSAFVDGGWERVKTMEVLDCTTGEWHTCNDIPKPLAQLQAVVVDDTLYLLGGANQAPSAEVFSASLSDLQLPEALPTRLKWQTMKNTPYLYCATVGLLNKYILAFGGKSQQEYGTWKWSNTVYALNKLTSSWVAIGEFPMANAQSAAVVTEDDRMVILTCGSTNQESSTKTVWIGMIDYCT